VYVPKHRRIFCRLTGVIFASSARLGGRPSFSANSLIVVTISSLVIFPSDPFLADNSAFCPFSDNKKATHWVAVDLMKLVWHSRPRLCFLMFVQIRWFWFLLFRFRAISCDDGDPGDTSDTLIL
jgi:hypothetical protein